VKKAREVVLKALREEGIVTARVLRAKLSDAGHGYTESGFREFMRPLIDGGLVRHDGVFYFLKR
jgi:hypothetical protein